MNFLIPDMGKIATAIGDHTEQGYVFNSYGPKIYLKHVISNIVTLRRYDQSRPVALYCSENHLDLIKQSGLEHYFQALNILPEENRSVIGFKHNIYKFMPFKENLFLDSDILWCRNPDKLWKLLSPYRFTITGTQKADIFFGGPKGVAIALDFLLNRRKRTLEKFNLTYLSRVQAGMIYSADRDLTESVCRHAREFFSRRDETHFVSRKNEKGRKEETCEWSLAMAMSAHKLQVFPWHNGYESAQLDYFEDYTFHDEYFYDVQCLYYSNKFKNDLKALKNRRVRNFLFRLLLIVPNRGDHLYVTPYCLHFGWLHQKENLNRFSEICWDKTVNHNVRRGEKVESAGSSGNPIGTGRG